MKKLLLVLAIGATITACNNNAGDKPASDSTAVAPTDTTKPAVVDTMKHDSAAMMAPKADSTKT